MTKGMDKPELETLDYKPELCHNTMTGRECIDCEIEAAGKCHLASAPRPTVEKITPIIELETGGKKEEVAGQPFQESLCRESEPEQPICKTCGDKGILVQLTETANLGIVGGHTYSCPDCKPNANAMIFEQINGSTRVSLELLGQIRPVTEDVKGCIRTLKAWQDNNYEHLQKAFE